MWHYHCKAQQSNVYIKESKNSKIDVDQKAHDSFQNSSINLDKSDSNTIQVTQRSIRTSERTEEKKGGFKALIANTDSTIKLFISIAILIGLLWRGIQYLKKRKKRKKNDET